MIINFDKKTHTLWHSGCETAHAPPMEELTERDDRTLMKCTHCGKTAFYPHGKSGPIDCIEEHLEDKGT